MRAVGGTIFISAPHAITNRCNSIPHLGLEPVSSWLCQLAAQEYVSSYYLSQNIVLAHKLVRCYITTVARFLGLQTVYDLGEEKWTQR